MKKKEVEEKKEEKKVEKVEPLWAKKKTDMDKFKQFESNSTYVEPVVEKKKVVVEKKVEEPVVVVEKKKFVVEKKVEKKKK